jgi:hypothetical protein
LNWELNQVWLASQTWSNNGDANAIEDTLTRHTQLGLTHVTNHRT